MTQKYLSEDEKKNKEAAHDRQIYLITRQRSIMSARDDYNTLRNSLPTKGQGGIWQGIQRSLNLDIALEDIREILDSLSSHDNVIPMPAQEDTYFLIKRRRGIIPKAKAGALRDRKAGWGHIARRTTRVWYVKACGINSTLSWAIIAKIPGEKYRKEQAQRTGRLA